MGDKIPNKPNKKKKTAAKENGQPADSIQSAKIKKPKKQY